MQLYIVHSPQCPAPSTVSNRMFGKRASATPMFFLLIYLLSPPLINKAGFVKRASPCVSKGKSPMSSIESERMSSGNLTLYFGPSLSFTRFVSRNCLIGKLCIEMSSQNAIREKTGQGLRPHAPPRMTAEYGRLLSYC